MQDMAALFDVSGSIHWAFVEVVKKQNTIILNTQYLPYAADASLRHPTHTSRHGPANRKGAEFWMRILESRNIFCVLSLNFHWPADIIPCSSKFSPCSSASLLPFVPAQPNADLRTCTSSLHLLAFPATHPATYRTYGFGPGSPSLRLFCPPFCGL